MPLNKWIPDHGARSVSVDVDGRTYVGGDFRNFGPRTGGLWHLTSTADTPLGPFADFAGEVNAVIPDGAGGWYAGGNFTYAGGAPHARLAHVLADGTVDPAWTPSVANDCDGTIYGHPGVDALLLSGTDLYVGGCFKGVNGQFRNKLAKLSTLGSGALDPSFATQADGSVLAMTESNGELVVGGEFGGIGGQTRNGIAKMAMTGAGTVDPTWDPNADDTVESLAASGNDVFAGGEFANIGGQARGYVAKLAADGTGAADPTWDASTNDNVRAITVSGTDVYIGGEFRGPAGYARVSRIPISGTGVADGWGPLILGADGIGGNVTSIAVSGDDVYIGGKFETANGAAHDNFVKVSASTNSVDTNWTPKPNSSVRALAVSGTDVYAGGAFTMYPTAARAGLARLDADGNLDMTWNPDATPGAGQQLTTAIDSVAVAGNYLYVGGGTIFIRGQAHYGLVRIPVNGDGAADPVWSPEVDHTAAPVVGAVLTMAPTSDGLIIGGTFDNVGGQARTHLAKVSLTGTGAVDPAWAPTADSGNVYSLLLSGKSLFVGGGFLSINGAGNTRALAKLSPSGTGAVDPTWTVEAGGLVAIVQGLALAGDKLFVGGSFTRLGSYQRITIGKVSIGGGGVVDPNWDPGVDYQSAGVHAVAVAGGDVYAGGDMRSLGVPDHYSDNLGKLSATGTGTGDLNWHAFADSTVTSLASSGTRLAAGGNFSNVGTAPTTGAAVFDIPVVGPVFGPLSTVSATGSTAPQSVATAVDSSGNATLAWVGKDAGDGHARVHVRTRAADGTLGAEQTLSPSDDAANVATAMTPGGDAVIAWQETDGTNQRIVVTRRTSAGVVQTAKAVSGAGHDADTPRVVIGLADRATVIWTRPDSSGSPRLQSRTVAADMKLGTAHTLSSVNASASQAQIAVNGDGDKVVAWVQNNGSGNEIWARVLTPTEAVGPLRRLDTSFADSSKPDVAVDASGRATVVWKTMSAAPAGVISVRRMTPDGTRTALQRVSILGRDIVDTPHVAVTPAGDAQVVWTNDLASGATNPWILARTVSAGGATGTITQVSTRGATADEPRITMDELDHATILYNREDRGLLTRTRASDGVMSPTKVVATGSIGTTPTLLDVAGTQASGLVAVFAKPTGAVRTGGT